MNQYKLADCQIVNQGKSKIIYKLEDNLNFMVFKPHLRSITYNREGNIQGTEIERLKACLAFMNLLEDKGIATQLSGNEIVVIDGVEGILVQDIKPIPIEFISRFYASGSIVRLFPSLVKEGEQFKQPLFKYDLKQDISVAGVDDPMLNESYIVGLDLLTQSQFEKSKALLSNISDTINELFNLKNIKLIDMKMEFGFNQAGDIVLIDEISQDCIRANDKATDKTITKDAYRQMKTEEEVLNLYKMFNNVIFS